MPDTADRLSVGFDREDGEAAIVVLRDTGEHIKMLVGLHGKQAEELYKYLTDQEYAMKNIPQDIVVKEPK